MHEYSIFDVYPVYLNCMKLIYFDVTCNANIQFIAYYAENCALITRAKLMEFIFLRYPSIFLVTFFSRKGISNGVTKISSLRFLITLSLLIGGSILAFVSLIFLFYFLSFNWLYYFTVDDISYWSGNFLNIANHVYFQCHRLLLLLQKKKEHEVTRISDDGRWISRVKVKDVLRVYLAINYHMWSRSRGQPLWSRVSWNIIYKKPVYAYTCG